MFEGEARCMKFASPAATASVGSADDRDPAANNPAAREVAQVMQGWIPCRRLLSTVASCSSNVAPATLELVAIVSFWTARSMLQREGAEKIQRESEQQRSNLMIFDDDLMEIFWIFYVQKNGWTSGFALDLWASVDVLRASRHWQPVSVVLVAASLEAAMEAKEKECRKKKELVTLVGCLEFGVAVCPLCLVA